MMKKPVIAYMTLASFIGLMAACVHEPLGKPMAEAPVEVIEETCDTNVVYFQEQILPIFQGCATTDCHDAASHEDGVILDTYYNIITTGEIELGNPGDSEVFEVITESDPDDVMPPPPNEPLSQDKIDLIQAWIAQGAPNNSCPDIICDTLEVTFSGDIYPLVDAFCIQCHSGIEPYGGIGISDYDEISAVASESTFLGLIGGEFNTVMPPNTTGLSDCQVRMFEIWIENGMPND